MLAVETVVEHSSIGLSQVHLQTWVMMGEGVYPVVKVGVACELG